MTFKELMEYHKNNSKNTIIKVVSKTGIEDETYAEIGMVGKLETITYDRTIDCYIFIINWNGYESNNEQFESSDWYIGSGTDKLGTMKEAGMYPEDGKEKYYFDKEYIESNNEKCPFDLLDNNNCLLILLNHYNEIDSDIPFNEWMANLICEGKTIDDI